MPDDPEKFSADAASSHPLGLPSQPSDLPLAPRDIWTPRDLLLFVCFIPAAFLASDLIALLGYVALRPFVGWQESAQQVQKNTFFLLIMQCLFYVLVLGFLFLASKVGHHQPFWKSLGWRRPTGKLVAGCLAGGCGLAVLATLALAVQPDTRTFPLEGLFDSRAASFAIGTFAIAVAPLVEEVVFRGLLFAICEREGGLNLAVVATAVLFAVLHIPEYWPAWNHVLIIFVVGMVFSAARGLSGSLTPSIILHFAYNSLMMTGLFFSTQHFRATQSVFAPW